MFTVCTKRLDDDAKCIRPFLEVGTSVLQCQLTFTFISLVYFKKVRFVKYGQNLKAATNNRCSLLQSLAVVSYR